MPWLVYTGTEGKRAIGPEVGGDLTSHHRLEVHFEFCPVFKSHKNVTLLVQWIKWIKGVALTVLTWNSKTCSERQRGK